MLESLTDRMTSALRNLRGVGKLSEENMGGLMRIIIISALFVALGGSVEAKQTITLQEINETEIIGQLGVPMHTVRQVECVVVDMTFTRAKADYGRLALRILSVDGEPLKADRFIDYPEKMAQKPKLGATYKFWAYETIDTAGYPHEAFEMMGEDSIAVEGLHFRPKLVVLKEID